MSLISAPRLALLTKPFARLKSGIGPLTGLPTIILRQYLSWRPYFGNFVVLYLFDPVLQLYALGLGLGAMMNLMSGPDGVAYLLFVVSGFVAGSTLWSAVMDGAYPTFHRVENGQWKAALSTPTSLRAIIWGENIFAATRGLIPATLVYAVGRLFGADIPLTSFLLTLPVIWLGALTIHASMQAYTAHVKNPNGFDFIWPLYVSPMFLFSGIFIATNVFPGWIQTLSWLLPLTHVVAVVRPLMLGTAGPAVLLHMGVLLAMWAACTAYAHHRFKKRLFD